MKTESKTTISRNQAELHDRDVGRKCVTNYQTFIATIAVALLVLFFTTISAQIQALNNRLCAVEQQIAAISVRLGIDPGQAAAQKGPATDARAATVDERGEP